MTLTDELQRMLDNFTQKVDPQIRQTMVQATNNLASSGIEKKALHQGDSIPLFSLPDQNGIDQSIQPFLNKGPIVLSLYRGGWCPYCNLELKALEDYREQFEALGANLVAISPEQPDKALDTQTRNELKFTVLSDQGNKVAKEFGLVFSLAEELKPIYKNFGIDVSAHNGDENYELPLAATYVVDENGNIVYDFVKADYTKRADPEDILYILKKAQKQT